MGGRAGVRRRANHGRGQRHPQLHLPKRTGRDGHHAALRPLRDAGGTGCLVPVRQRGNRLEAPEGSDADRHVAEAARNPERVRPTVQGLPGCGRFRLPRQDRLPEGRQVADVRRRASPVRLRRERLLQARPLRVRLPAKRIIQTPATRTASSASPWKAPPSASAWPPTATASPK